MTGNGLNAIEARFSSQEQAEAAMRKLASLRVNKFRLERPFSSSVAADDTEFGDFAEGDADCSVCTLTVDVPDVSLEQARRVIQDLGGTETAVL